MPREGEGGEGETRVALTNVPHTTEGERERSDRNCSVMMRRRGRRSSKRGDGRGRDAKMTRRGHVDKVLETREAEGS